MYVSLQEYARERLGEMGVEAERGAEERHGRWYAHYGTEEALADLEQHGGIARRRGWSGSSRTWWRRAGAPWRGRRRDGGGGVLAPGRPCSRCGARSEGRWIWGGRCWRWSWARKERARALLTAGTGGTTSGRMERRAPTSRRRWPSTARWATALRGQPSSATWAILHQEQGRMEEARAHYEAALAIHREVGDRRAEGIVLGNLGSLHQRSGSDGGGARPLRGGARHPPRGRRPARRGHRPRQPGRPAPRAGPDGGGARPLRGGAGHPPRGGQPARRGHRARQPGQPAPRAGPDGGGARQLRGGARHPPRGRQPALRGHRPRQPGHPASEQGRMEEARAHLRGGAGHPPRGGRPALSRASSSATWASCTSEQGRMEEARAHYEAALAHPPRGGRSAPPKGIVLSDLGPCTAIKAGWRRHVPITTAALAIHREMGDRRNEGIVLGRLGDLHRRQGRSEESRDAIERAEAMLREVGDPIELATVLCTRAELERRTGDVATALAALAEAQQLAERAGAGPQSELGRLLANAHA